MKKITKLKRYTTLPILLDMLDRKKLTLLTPDLWDDKNDSAVIHAYKSRKAIKSLHAVCLSQGDDTVHHWKTFSGGGSGCMIEFDAPKLFELLKGIPGIRHGVVRYKKLSDVEGKNFVIDLDQMPFTKRWPYRCEEEYRIILEGDHPESFYDIDMPLNLIRRITVSQQMPRSVFKTIKGYLKGITKNPESKIYQSTLYENKRWIKCFSQD
ncbi:hypothetical protein AAFN85_02965 [Mucilaginibacter sp. CAU 1740]|uniref:hypothetical protein n=1 Tax=Mucilaginibacter sp. CAU 1740 TaxID=3140365 RepID=UPI00325B550D